MDWFHFDLERLTGKRHFAAYPDPAARNALRRGVGSREALGYQAWWDLPALPKFNIDTPAVREFLWSVATHWIEFGIDGWRLDVAAEIKDQTFWQEFRQRVKTCNPEAYLVGEDLARGPSPGCGAISSTRSPTTRWRPPVWDFLAARSST